MSQHLVARLGPVSSPVRARRAPMSSIAAQRPQNQLEAENKFDEELAVPRPRNPPVTLALFNSTCGGEERDYFPRTRSLSSCRRRAMRTDIATISNENVFTISLRRLSRLRTDLVLQQLAKFETQAASSLHGHNAVATWVPHLAQANRADPGFPSTPTSETPAMGANVWWLTWRTFNQLEMAAHYIFRFGSQSPGLALRKSTWPSLPTRSRFTLETAAAPVTELKDAEPEDAQMSGASAAAPF
ncbi:hypothetical protein V8E36_005942 [Tilletia maclaganii]